MLQRVLWYCYRLSKLEWLRPRELRTLQERSMRAILRHAYENVPLYHDKFDEAGIKIDDIRSLDDLARLPLTSKEEVRRGVPGASMARNFSISDCVRGSTSGTTGGAMPTFRDKRASDLAIAHRYFRRLRAMGLEPWDRLMRIYYSRPTMEIEMKHSNDEDRSEDRSRGREALGPSVSIFRHWIKNAYLGYDAQEILPDLLKYKPGIIEGNASYLRLIAETVKEKGTREIRPEALISRGEVLDEPTRTYLESSLECDVFNDYGAYEVGDIAWECQKREGLHITSDFMILEIVRNGEVVQPDEQGEIVVTGLTNYAMPLIRYRVGDIGMLSQEQCSCGRSFPLLGSIEGRITDFLTLPDGSLVSPRSIATVVQATPGVSRYQVVQENRNRIVIELMRKSNDPDVSVELIKANCHRILGDDVEIEVFVSDRKNLKAKFRPVVSKLTLSNEPRWTRPRPSVQH